MPAYSIQRDLPWIKEPKRGASYAPTESVYSEDYEGPPFYDHPDMPAIPPLRVNKSNHPSYHAHPQQQIRDIGPQVRQSRLPIFKQVRSMLQKPAKLEITHIHDTVDLSRNALTPDQRSPTYNSQYQGHYEPRQASPRRHQEEPKSPRSLSPVSILREDEIHLHSSHMDWDADEPPSPVSPVPGVSHDDDITPTGPSEVSVNTRAVLQTPPHPRVNVIKRKPAPSTLLDSVENVPQLNSQPREDEFGTFDEPHVQHKSHFSWTTVAPSVAPARSSTDTRPSPQISDYAFPQSRFSWSTANTSAPTQMRPETPPPSPPTLPSQYRAPPVQSILSRHRPVQRLEKEVWTPPPRKVSLPASHAVTPTSARSKLSVDPRQTPDNGAGSSKKLPPPPQLLTPISPMSRLETLLTEEEDKQQQRRNMEKAIAEYTRIEMASPMDVSFAQLREAKRKLGELRTTLAEVQLEEREIGIAISRARRKEGEEEGLWVRRVTG